MKRTNAKITEMAAVLNSGSDASSNPMTLGGGLEGTWREYGGKMYYFVLNFSHAAARKAKVTLTGVAGKSMIEVMDESRKLTAMNGSIVDHFAPYQLHIYETTATAGNFAPAIIVASAVPEPVCMTGLMLTGGMLMRRCRPAKASASLCT